MDNIYITGIKINKYRNIKNLDIRLSNDSRQHLILTGNNGSGKTSLLGLMVDNFADLFLIMGDVMYETTTNLYDMSDRQNMELVGSVSFNKNAGIRNVLMVNMPAEHLFHVSKSLEITGIKDRYKHEQICKPKESIYKNILQTMVTMRIQQLEAKENNETELLKQSEKWFNALNRVLCTIYENQTIELKYIPQAYNYKIILDGYEFDLNQMADGYSAFFRIVSELMEKMDNYTEYSCDYTLPAIAFIDELETHMHISMQKMALRFLTEMFPNVQFIITTHSPFVINSLENAVVYDLSRRESLENPSQYSYESIVEGYYDIDMYSQIMNEKFERYKQLALNNRSVEEEKEFSKLRVEMQTVSPAQKEIYIAFSNIENKRKRMDNG